MLMCSAEDLWQLQVVCWNIYDDEDDDNEEESFTNSHVLDGANTVR